MKVSIDWSHNMTVKTTNERKAVIKYSGDSEEPLSSPMEGLLSSLGACSSMDIISILKKKRVVLKSLSVEVIGERDEGNIPAIFKKIHLHYKVKCTPSDDAKVRRSVELSVEKYCSVSRMIEALADVTYSYELV